MLPRIVPDRDRIRKWYLDEDFVCTLTDGTVLDIKKGFRFDGHSTGWLRFIFPKHNGTDIVAALVHDYLLNTAPWHRFDRRFMDQQYAYYHSLYGHSRFRSFFMPKGVYIWGFLSTWGYSDYRGTPKPNTVISVQVTHGEVDVTT